MKSLEKILQAAGLMMALTILASCGKQLDQTPSTQKTLSNFFRTENELEEYINAVYGTLQLQGTYGLYFPALAEIPSDNTFDEVPANDGQVYGQLDEFATVPGNGLTSQVWRDHYKGIQASNVVLNRIDGVTYKNEAIKKARIGEMQFIRALLYFNLVRSFGDVPLVVKETINPNEYFGQGRTPQEEVYQQIITDLKDAITNLPDDQTKQGKARKQAANTLMAHVHLFRGNKAAAKPYLLDVVKSKKHKLVAIDRLFAIDNENNDEIIFDVQFASGINGNSEGSSMQQQFSPSGTLANAKGHNLPTKSLYSLYTANDLRKQYYVGLTANNIPYNKKLVQPTTAPADGGSNFIVFRYADVLLLLAEIETDENNTDEALDYLNQVHERAGLSPITTKDQNELRELIDLERRLELICEGYRWFDLIRSGTAITVMNNWFKQEGIKITINERHLLMPIPQGQIDTDPSIKPNPSYNK